MIVPERDDSASDISSNSSWTVLDQTSAQLIPSHDVKDVVDAKDVTDTPEVFEHIEKTEVTPSDGENEIVNTNSAADDSVDVQNTESGFLTLEEFVRQRELEHDYEHDETLKHFKEMLERGEFKTQRKKSKAGQIGTLSVIGTVLAVTGLSFLCLLVPSDNPSASAAANVKSKLPNFSEVQNSISYTCPVYQDENDTALKIIDDGGFIKEFLKKNNANHKTQHTKANTVGPIKREEYLKKHVPVINNAKSDINKFGNFTTRHQQTADIERSNRSKTSFSRKSRSLQLKDTEIVNPNHVLSTAEAQPATTNEKKNDAQNFLPSLFKNTCYICQDLILLNMLGSLKKGTTVHKILREKRKHLSKESLKKERKQLRLLKVDHYDSSTDIEYEKEDHQFTKAPIKLKKVFKKLKIQGAPKTDKQIFTTNKPKANNKVCKTDNLKLDVDLRHVPSIQQPQKSICSFSVTQCSTKDSKSDEQKLQKNVETKDSQIRSVMPLNKRREELTKHVENIKEIENEYKNTLTGEAITPQRKIAYLKNIRQARKELIESLKKQPKQRQNGDIKECKSIATGFYKVPDVDNKMVTKKLQELQNVKQPYGFSLTHNDIKECKFKTPSDKKEDAMGKISKSREAEQRTLDSAHHVFEAYNRWAEKAKKTNISNTELPKINKTNEQNMTGVSKPITGCLELPSEDLLYDGEKSAITANRRWIDEIGETQALIAEGFALERNSKMKKELSESTVKDVLDSIIQEAVKETKKNKKRRKPRISVSETDVDHADDEMSFSDSSLSPLSIEESYNIAPSLEKPTKAVEETDELVVAQKCDRAQGLYFWLFGERGQEVINKDHARWLLKKYPSTNCVKPISKQDPKKCYVQKVTKF